MLNLAVIGLGHIAQKAYLPYMNQLPDVHWHFWTRNEKTLARVAATFGTRTTYGSFADLLEAKLDGVFIHAATPAHVLLASAFLERGIPVYMDKPLAESYEEARDLYLLAERTETFLMTGFNRRFAPRVTELKELSDKRRIWVEKNDVNRPGDLTFKLFDFFIHPLDTALFLADEPLEDGFYHYQLADGLVSQVSVTLTTATSSIVASLNLQSGSRREIMEVQTPTATHSLENLDLLTSYEGDYKGTKAFGSWDRTLYKRGFESAIDRFIEAIRTGKNPVPPRSSLLSHYICHQINHAKTRTGRLDVELPQEDLWT